MVKYQINVANDVYPCFPSASFHVDVYKNTSGYLLALFMVVFADFVLMGGGVCYSDSSFSDCLCNEMQCYIRYYNFKLVLIPKTPFVGQPQK